MGGQKIDTLLLSIGNTLGAFKDKQHSAKFVGRTHHIEFSDPINLARSTYCELSNHDKQSLKSSK